METLILQQGSEAWRAERMRCFTASEAPAMMGASKYMTRNQLLDLKATGKEEEITPAKQAIFNRGHAAEASMRPIFEAKLGEDLSPVTGVVEIDGLRLLASFDGLTMFDDVLFEHKLWNESLAQDVSSEQLGPHFYWQLEQQLLVSGAKQAFFVVSDGTEEKMEWMEYTPVHGRREALIAGWKQFAEDLANYQPSEKAPEIVPAAQAALPAVSVQVSGEIAIIDNLETFGHALTEYTQGLNLSPQTDQDFANLDAAAKSLKIAEGALQAAEDSALAQTASIQDMRSKVATFRNLAREFRLRAEKTVKTEKENRRNQIAMNARHALQTHVDRVNTTLEGAKLPGYTADFANAMKGKKTISSLQSAADDELARAKIDINQMADEIRRNLKTFKELAADYGQLFPDLQQIISKEEGDFAAVVKQRIAEHREAEERRLEAERERIRREEAARIEREHQEQAFREEQERRREAQEEEDRIRAAEAARHQQDPRGNPAEATHGDPQATESPQAPAASTSPNMPNMDALIDEYIAQADMADRTAVTVRKHLAAFAEFVKAKRDELKNAA